MLFHLVKKDLLLVKNYLLVMLLFAFGGPLFIISKIDMASGGFIPFFTTVIFIEYLIFASVSTQEDKYKGSAFLCATPYRRNNLVKAKYLLVLTLFLCSYLIYTITSFAVSGRLEAVTFLSFGVSFLLIAVFFGVLIPVQYKYGYEKTKYISIGIIFFLPFTVPTLIKWYQDNYSNLHFDASYPPFLLHAFPCLLALLAGFISMRISVHIFSSKDL